MMVHVDATNKYDRLICNGSGNAVSQSVVIITVAS